MDITILKCENGWQIIRSFANRAETKVWIFGTLSELAGWIIENVPD